jgi:cyclase
MVHASRQPRVLGPRAGLLGIALAALCVAGVPIPAHAQFDDVEIKTTHVAGNVYMLEGQGGNIGVAVAPDGVLLIDDEFAPLAPKIRAAIAALSDQKIKFILNTHWHGDHTGGNRIFGPEAPIIAQQNVRERLASGMDLPGRKIEPAPGEALPVVTFIDSISIWFNDEEVRVIHLPPGHTDGDAVVFFTKSNVVHTGDDMFSGRFPIIDLASGGSVDGYVRNVEAILDRLPRDAHIIPGHGPLATVGDLRDFREMLIGTTHLVQARVNHGKSLEEIKEEGLPDRYSKWAWEKVPTDRWIETVYRDYTREP